MGFSQFFVQRPIFAAVLSAIIFIAGALSLRLLPISEYPEVVPPTVVVRAIYPGANPQVIAETVAAPLEQAINGVERHALHVVAVDGRRPDDADRHVRARHRPRQGAGAGAEPRLADAAEAARGHAAARCRRPRRRRRTSRWSCTWSRPTTATTCSISPNYATLHVRDELARIEGVGDARVFGAGDYAMRVWLDPEKVAALNLTASDVVRAIREQNVQVAAGQLGAPPAPNAARLPALDRHARAPRHRGRVRGHRREGRRPRPDHALARRRARRARREHLRAALAARRRARRRDPDLSAALEQQRDRDLGQGAREDGGAREGFPAGRRLRDRLRPDHVRARSRSTPSCTRLFEALLLVVLVVVLFLQTWRASVIPLAAVPVSLVGTLAVMHLFGFSLNALSLFGLVLAIGIVVDDAIVVVENVERNIARGLAPVAAAQQAMREVTSPIIATALVLIAVFVPTAFISGLAGQFYQQFALTIAISTVISAFNSLTLSPALAAVLLKPHGAAARPLAARPSTPRSAGRSGRSIGSSSGRRCATSASRAACCARSGSRSPSTAAARSSPGSASRACPRASSRSRTSSISSRTRSCRRPRRSTAPRR